MSCNTLKDEQSLKPLPEIPDEIILNVKKSFPTAQNIYFKVIENGKLWEANFYTDKMESYHTLVTRSGLSDTYLKGQTVPSILQESLSSNAAFLGSFFSNYRISDNNPNAEQNNPGSVIYADLLIENKQYKAKWVNEISKITNDTISVFTLLPQNVYEYKMFSQSDLPEEINQVFINGGFSFIHAFRYVSVLEPNFYEYKIVGIDKKDNTNIQITYPYSKFKTISTITKANLPSKAVEFINTAKELVGMKDIGCLYDCKTTLGYTKVQDPKTGNTINFLAKLGSGKECRSVLFDEVGNIVSNIYIKYPF
ncbi:MAG: hypothetical protein KA313_03610 [Pseudarcicella sp.]|nr:hypothetical protein [Pseudarcicella sp.]MBP6410161.1 hypothetical protein [Pseudarcicella sp.]